MQSSTYEPVPFAIGGVAHPKPAPMTIDASSPAKHFGPRDANGFRPLFFARPASGNETEARLQLDWRQAAVKAIAKAYSQDLAHKKGSLVSLLV